MDGKLYTWAGKHDGLPHVHDSEEKMKWISNIDVFTLKTGLWANKATEGIPPLGVMGYSCTSINYNICYFGGSCVHDPIDDVCDGYHNSIYMLNVNSLHWKQISPTSDNNSVMRRCWGGMISFGDNSLFLIGGYGPYPTTPHHGATYSKSYGGQCITNECNILNTTTSKYAYSPHQCP